MISIAIALVASAPSAAMPAPTPPPLVAPAPAHGAAALKAVGMSDAGIAVLRQQSAPDPDAKAAFTKRQAMRAKLAQAASANPFDLDAFASALREASLLEATARSRNEERIVTTLKALPAADRPIFAKAVFGNPAAPSPGAVPKPPVPPKPAN